MEREWCVRTTKETLEKQEKGRLKFIAAFNWVFSVSWKRGGVKNE